MAITETWLLDGASDAAIAELVPPGYSILNVPRKSGTGGGVAIIYKSIKASSPPVKAYSSFEYAMLLCISMVVLSALLFCTVQKQNLGTIEPVPSLSLN